MRQRVDLDNPAEHEIVLAAMKYVNSKQEYFEHLYDCGSFGWLHMTWGHLGKWQCHWIKPDLMPIEIGSLLYE